MPTSEARSAASRINGSKSVGPTSTRGREISSRNSLKHGLSGQGIVIAEVDETEVDRRKTVLLQEMAPISTMGVILVSQMAMLSVRMERAAEQEIAAVASRVRNAASEFDEARYQRAEELLLGLGENPRGNLRRLLKMPEGVELMIQSWNDLRSDLNREGKPLWTAAHLVEAASLMGIRDEDSRRSPIGQLSRGVWGEFAGAIDDESEDVAHEVSKAQAVAKLLEKIDEEIADLEELYDTLDFETIALDRAEAGPRASFDPSKEACLARRYESEARRGYYKALKEFKAVEAEAADKGVPAPRAATPLPAPASATLGSSRETPAPAIREPAKPIPAASRPVSTVVSSEVKEQAGNNFPNTRTGSALEGGRGYGTP
jgi:hypothetical protein